MRDLVAFKRILTTNKDFRRIWLSHMVSLIGDWLSYIAVAVISIEKGEGALAVAMVMVVHSLPTAIVAPIAGRFADRFDRKSIMLVGYGLSALLTMGMFAAAKAEMLYTLQGILLLRVAASTVALTARASVIPSLVPRDSLRIAHALLGLSWSVMFTLGLALGGLATEYLSPSGAILIDAFTFVCAGLIITGLPKLRPQASEEATGKAQQIKVGVWRYLWRRPRLLSYVLSKVPAMVINSGAWVTLNLVAGERLSPLSTALALGILQCARAIGSGVGPLIPNHLWPRRPLAGVVLMMIGVVMFGVSSGTILTLVGLFLWGAGGGHNWVMSSTASQSNTDDEYMGRVAGADALLFSLGSSGAALLSGYVSESLQWAEAGCWVTFGVGCVLWFGCLALRLKSPPLKEDLSQSP